MKKKVFLSAIIFIIIVTSSWATGKKEDGVTEIKISTDLPSSHVLIPPMVEFSEEVFAESNGTLKIDVFTDSTLGQMSAVIDSVRQGTVQMVTTAVELSVFDPMIGIIDFPFLFSNYEEARAIIMGTDIFKEMTSENLPEKANLRMLEIYPIGLRNFVSSNPIRKASDLEKQRLRVPNIPLYLNLFRSFGINGQVVNIQEAVTAVEQGVIDGLDGAFSTMISLGVHEVAPYFFAANHMMLMYGFCINEKFYQKLSEEHKEILDKAVRRMTEKSWDIIMTSDKKLAEYLVDNGCEVVYPTQADTDELKLKALPIMEKFYKDIDGSREFVDKIEKLKSEL